MKLNNIKNKPLVSILTPVFNANKYLEQCIQSVLKQTYSNIEHIFADGGSTDGTLATLAQYNKIYPERIKYISESDQGVGSALKKAYKKSRGQIIGWIDADDIYEPIAVTTAVNYFSANIKTSFIYGRCNIINAETHKIGCFVIKDFNKKVWLNEWHYIVFCATFFKREVVEKVGFVNDLGNDLYFYLKVAKKYKMERINEVLTNWRLHDESISLKNSEREIKIRKQRAKEDFMLLLKHGGSIFSPRALIYYDILENLYLKQIYPYIFKVLPFMKTIDKNIKTSMYVVNRDGNSYAFPLIKKICSEFIRPVKNRLKGIKFYDNKLYNSANIGFIYNRAGQRINNISSGSKINNVSFYMDKIGKPNGVGRCKIRRVSDDFVVGTLGSVDVSRLPDAISLCPKWILFDANEVRIPTKGDYRILFEWDIAGGDLQNYPRLRYDNSNKTGGVFTQYNGSEKWIDHPDSDATIKLRIN